MKNLDFSIDFHIRKGYLIADIPMIGTKRGRQVARTWNKPVWEGRELDEWFDDIKEELISRIINKQ